MKDERNIRGMIRHRAKQFLLEGKSDMVRFAYDGDKLYAIYDHDDQQEVFEVNIDLLPTNTELSEDEDFGSIEQIAKQLHANSTRGRHGQSWEHAVQGGWLSKARTVLQTQKREK